MKLARSVKRANEKMVAFAHLLRKAFKVAVVKSFHLTVILKVFTSKYYIRIFSHVFYIKFKIIMIY